MNRFYHGSYCNSTRVRTRVFNVARASKVHVPVRVWTRLGSCAGTGNCPGLKMCTWDQKHQNIRTNYIYIEREHCHRNPIYVFTMIDHATILLLHAREYCGRMSVIILCASTAEDNKATAAASDNVHLRTESHQNIRSNYIYREHCHGNPICHYYAF